MKCNSLKRKYYGTSDSMDKRDIVQREEMEREQNKRKNDETWIYKW